MILQRCNWQDQNDLTKQMFGYNIISKRLFAHKRKYRDHIREEIQVSGLQKRN